MRTDGSTAIQQGVFEKRNTMPIFGHIDGHEIAMLSTIGGAVGVTHGIYGAGWFKSLIHRQPIIAFSVTIAAIGVCMPLVIVPLRRKLGLPTNQYDHMHPKTVWPKLIE